MIFYLIKCLISIKGENRITDVLNKFTEYKTTTAVKRISQESLIQTFSISSSKIDEFNKDVNLTLVDFNGSGRNISTLLSKEKIKSTKNNSDIRNKLQFEEILICNRLPSILKCQNKKDYLFIEKVIKGVNSRLNCDVKDLCKQVYYEDRFNCTGLNFCMIYPSNEALSSCKKIESNLTQIFVTCVNEGYFFKG